MEVISPNLCSNISNVLQKKIQINDLRYDHYSKFLAAACKSQSGPEIIILEKEGTATEARTLKQVSSIITKYDPVMVFWAPPSFGMIIVVVLSDNSVVYYKRYTASYAPKDGGDWAILHEKNDLGKSLSCLSVGESSCGELLVALGSPDGTVTIISSGGSYETTTFTAHLGGVGCVSIRGDEGCLRISGGGTSEVLIASGGIDGCVKIWKFADKKSQLMQTLPIISDPKLLPVIKSLCWSKSGETLAAATERKIFIFQKDVEWSGIQSIDLPSTSEKTSIAFSNDRIIVLQEGDAMVYKRDDDGTYKIFGKLS